LPAIAVTRLEQFPPNPCCSPQPLLASHCRHKPIADTGATAVPASAKISSTAAAPPRAASCHYMPPSNPC
jgi:hypothetical protein